MFFYLISLSILIVFALWFIFGRALLKSSSFLAVFFIATFMVLGFWLNFQVNDVKTSLSDFKTQQAYNLELEHFLNADDAPESLSQLKEIDGLVLFSKLKRHLQGNGKDIQAWIAMANLLEGFQAFDQAVDAYRKAHFVAPENSALALRYVNARLSLLDSADELDRVNLNILERLVDREPENEQAWIFLGITYFNAGYFEQAEWAWQNLLNRLRGVPEPEQSKALIDVMEKSITKAREKSSGLSGLGNAIDDDQASPQASVSDDSLQRASEGFELNIRLNFDERIRQRLAAELSPRAKLFVVLKKPKQPGMPLAALKLEVPDNLNQALTIKLTNSNSLSGEDLGQYPQLELKAHISASGLAVPKKGDWRTNTLVFDVQDVNDTKLLTLQDQVDLR